MLPATLLMNAFLTHHGERQTLQIPILPEFALPPLPVVKDNFVVRVEVRWAGSAVEVDVLVLQFTELKIPCGDNQAIAIQRRHEEEGYLVHKVKPDDMKARIMACLEMCSNRGTSMATFDSTVPSGHSCADQSMRSFMSCMVIASAWCRWLPFALCLFLIVFMMSSVPAARAGLPETFPLSSLNE
jgi:hypothetical protein